ncbi:MAG: PmoA family protein, partial [Candidatus Aminicenantes bacterium]|nr:PmoA family protein [Candidatus Aminicenantes bacterium]
MNLPLGRVTLGLGLTIWLATAATVQFTFVEDAKGGTVMVLDGQAPVLMYRFGDQLPAGADPKYMRSCYIHPLFGPDGRVLTDDFPADHLHHHGVFWTWPVVRTRGRDTQTWHPATPSLRQHFVRWLKQEVSGD